MTYLLRSKSGIYYYRKTSIDDAGKRRVIKKSLRTADHKLAQYLALKHYFGDVPVSSPVATITDQLSGAVVGAILPASRVEQARNSQPRHPLSKAIDQFLSEKHRAGYWTNQEYRRGEGMLNALSEHLGQLEVRRIGRQQSNEFKQWLLASERSITTINNYLKRAAMLFDWLMQRGEAVDNPFRGTNVKQRRQTSKLRNAWTPAEKNDFLAFATSQAEWRKWILLILRYTGARPGEICQLYRDDINLKAKTLSIQTMHPDQTLKTLSSCRTLPIHSKLIAAGFLKYVEACSTPRLFPQLNCTQTGYSQTFTTWYSKQKADVALPGLYGARHTAATEMKNAGVPNQYASAVLGHSNSSITYDRYGKSVELQRLREAIEVIGN